MADLAGSSCPDLLAARQSTLQGGTPSVIDKGCFLVLLSLWMAALLPVWFVRLNCVATSLAGLLVLRLNCLVGHWRPGCCTCSVPSPRWTCSCPCPWARRFQQCASTRCRAVGHTWCSLAASIWLNLTSRVPQSGPSGRTLAGRRYGIRQLRPRSFSSSR